MSIISSLNMARDALAVNQAAITVVSNNIANVGTEGYSKLRVNQAASINLSGRSGNSAAVIAESLSGVSLESITRYSDSFMQSCYWDQNSIASYYNKYANAAGQSEDLMNELKTTGLAKALDTFYDAADALSNDPDNITSRTNYVSAAENLCSVFNRVSSDLTDLEKSLVGTSNDMSSSEMSSSISEANKLLDQIVETNKSIVSTATDGVPSPALLDKRDELVTQLSELTNISTSENDDGTIDISLGDYSLVNGTRSTGRFKVANSLDVDNNIVTTVSIVDPTTSKTVSSNVNSDITGGSIAAILDFCGTNPSKFTIKNVRDDLNAMANSFATVMNTLQTTANASGTPMCLNAAGTQLQAVAATDVMFTTSDGTATITAGNIRVRQAIIDNPFGVAAARVTNVADLTATGNNSNMKSIIEVRTKSSYYTGTSLEGSTLEGYLSDAVTDVGSNVKSVEDSYKTQNTVLTSTKTKLKSTTGVNLDEELGDLIKYQRAYEAAARVFSVCNELLNDLVNLGR